MATLNEDFGGQQAGHLIRHQLWNGLVETLDERLGALQTALDTGLEDVRSTIETLRGDVETLGGELETLRASVDPLIGAFRRVELRSGRTRHALGESAAIEVRVTDLAGNPAELGDEERPWVDLITSFGRLQPGEGQSPQDVRGGPGGRTLSLRVRPDGRASALLRAESSDDFDEDGALQVEETLSIPLAEAPGTTLARAILDAEVPQDPRAVSAFGVLSAEYERRSDGGPAAIVPFIDFQVARSSFRFDRVAFQPVAPLRWRDHFATVLAVVRDDADPTTPDAGRGVSSIQITFRDWIGSWLGVDYLADLDRMVAVFRTDFQDRLGLTLEGSVADFRERIQVEVADAGLVGRMKRYQAFERALEDLSVSGRPPFAATVRDSVRDAVAFQQVVETVQFAGPRPDAEVLAVETLVNSATRAERRAEEIGREVTGLRERVEGTAEEVGRVDERIAEVDRRAGDAFERASEVTERFGGLESQLVPLRDLNVSDVIQGLGNLRSVANRVDRLERDLTP